MRLLSVLCYIGVVIGIVYAQGKAKWGYEGAYAPPMWKKLGENSCGGDRQSPIDIDTLKVGENKSITDFVFEEYQRVLDNPMLENNGHTAQLTYNSSIRRPAISGGGLSSRYIFLQLHFHWGKSNGQGSEHTVNGVEYPLEMHLVHYNEKYGDVRSALNYGDGLAVLGILFKIGDYHSYINPIIRTLQKVRTTGTKTEIDGDIILGDLIPRMTTPFYRYEGSLTTPPCSEAVIWTVFANEVFISEKQLNEFRELLNSNDEQLGNNYRPPQELNGRVIQLYSKASTAVDVAFTNALSSLSAAVVVAIMFLRSGNEWRP